MESIEMMENGVDPLGEQRETTALQLALEDEQRARYLRQQGAPRGSPKWIRDLGKKLTPAAQCN